MGLRVQRLESQEHVPELHLRLLATEGHDNIQLNVRRRPAL